MHISAYHVSACMVLMCVFTYLPHGASLCSQWCDMCFIPYLALFSESLQSKLCICTCANVSFSLFRRCFSFMCVCLAVFFKVLFPWWGLRHSSCFQMLILHSILPFFSVPLLFTPRPRPSTVTVTLEHAHTTTQVLSPFFFFFYQWCCVVCFPLCRPFGCCDREGTL